MIKGKVISFDGNIGFIRIGKDSYFFNKRSFLNANDFSNVSLGITLEFQPKAGPKGMRADKAIIKKYYIGVDVNNASFIYVSKHKSIDDILLIGTKPIESEWHKSPQAAKDQVAAVAKSSNCNIIIPSSMDKDVFSNGNYRYTMHSYFANIGVYAHKKEYNTQQEADNSISIVQERYEKEILPVLDEKIRKLARGKKIQESTTTIMFFIVISIIAIGMILSF